MRIARVTVVEGNAHVEIEGLDVPVIVAEGKTLSLEMLLGAAEHREVLKFEWVELGDTKSAAVAINSKPAP